MSRRESRRGRPSSRRARGCSDGRARQPSRSRSSTTCDRSSCRCQTSGYYSHWRLTEAQGQTFADVEIGVEPIGLLGRVARVATTKGQLREVTDESLDGLRGPARNRIALRWRKPGSSPARWRTSEINVERGFDVIGFKERRRNQAEQFEPGDEVIFYVTGVQAFGGVARVTSEMFEDRDPIWPQGKKKQPRALPVARRGRAGAGPARGRRSSPPRSWSASSSTSRSGRPSTGISPSRASCGRSATPTASCCSSA